MKIDIVTTAELQEFKKSLLEEIKQILTTTKPQPVEKAIKWLKSHQVQRQLGISPGTLQTLRVNGTMPYSKIGGVIFYNSEDIEELMKKYKKNVFLNGRQIR